jgi:hypothetical protein
MKTRCGMCKRELYVLAGTSVLVCRTCDYATMDRGPVRSLRDQGERSS